MQVPLIDLRAQYLSIKDEVDAAIARVHQRGNYVMGHEVECFELEWAHYCGARFCVAVSSGTDALYLILRALGLKAQLVLTTPFTFFATVVAIILSGNTPLFIDVEEDGNIDISKDYSTLYNVPVHLYGRPAKVDLSSIEDTAQGHGIELTGLAQAYSFYPTKNLGAFGQGGAVVTNDSDLAQKVKELRVHAEKERFVHYAVSGNYRMDELQAAILRAKLPHLDGWIAKRRQIAEWYYQRLSQIEGVVLPPQHPGHTYHIFAIKLKERDALARFLAEKGTQTAVRYPVPMHLMPALKDLNYKRGDFPKAEEWAETVLNLPIYPEMNEEMVDYVCTSIREWGENDLRRN